jgi:two-component system nitrogen regulation sensor histidine kinase NtrY
VYELLFIFSLILGLVLSGYITRPLRIIGEELSAITLGRTNRRLAGLGTRSRDEIGRLAKAYNEMLVKLEKSAELLARSERESAWREMARQVAHEIKNPLTPMKLNLQYLRKLMKEDSQAFEEQFHKVSESLIEQIDSLAFIAEEFSSMARLPEGRSGAVNISEVILASVQIFTAQAGEVRIRNNSGGIPPVKGDREQYLRVFNNLLSNAISAVEGMPDPEIIIEYELKYETAIIYVKDNGSGIGEDVKEKIFAPNFTTKTTGSGLGLAIVKNIMDNGGGSIAFESQKGQGTVFRLEFMLAANTE